MSSGITYKAIAFPAHELCESDAVLDHDLDDEPSP
jgi:hypothetical protein